MAGDGDSDLEVEVNDDEFVVAREPTASAAGKVPIDLYTLRGTLIAEVLLDTDASVGQFKRRVLDALRHTDPAASLEWFSLRKFIFGGRSYSCDDEYLRLLATEPLRSLASAAAASPGTRITCTVVRFADPHSYALSSDER